jgi:hypothetical protein
MIEHFSGNEQAFNRLAVASLIDLACMRCNFPPVWATNSLQSISRLAVELKASWHDKSNGT